MRLSNVIFCLATAVVVTAQTAQSDREERGKCAVCNWVTSSFPVHLKHIPHRA